MKETPSPAPRDVPAKRGRPRGQSGAHHDLGEGASAEAKRLAAAILEVLAGARTPTEAAEALSLSLPRSMRSYEVVDVNGGQGTLLDAVETAVGALS